METLYFITGNEDKFEEAKKMLPSLEMLDFDLPEIQELDSKKIIEHKLREAKKKKDGNFLVEDTSFIFSALEELPGPLIKWFYKSLGNQGLYELIENREDNSAKVVLHLGLLWEGEIHFFFSKIQGEVLAPRGENGFDWDPIFSPEDSDRTFAQMTPEEKSDYMGSTIFGQVKDFLENQSDFEK